MAVLCQFQKPLLLAIGVSLLVGCGDCKPKTYAVKLPVTVNDQVPVGASVTLHPRNAAWAAQHPQRPYGKVGDDGTVRFSTFREGDGAPAGNYVVTLSWPALDGEHQSPERTNPLTLTIDKSGELPPVKIAKPTNPRK